MFNQKFHFEFDYFQEKRYDILRKRSAAIPNYVALVLPDENIGKTRNRGIELLFSYSDNIGGFNYNLGGNFTFNRNKVIYMSEAKDIPEWQRQEGYPLDSYLVYKVVGNGVINTQDELKNYPHRSGVQLGDLHLLDYNNDGYVNAEDMVRIFSSPRPEIQFGFNTSIEYKGFEIDLFWQGQARAKTLLRFHDTGNKPAYLFDRRWTEENSNSNYPAAYSQVNQSWNQLSEYHLKDATFLKLKNAEVSYNFINISRIPDIFKRLRVYVNATNIFTIAKGDLKHFDPEVINSLGRYHPQMSTVSAGLNMSIN